MISPAEQRERRDAVESVVGTHRAEGISFDPTTVKLMDSFVAGEFDLEQLLVAMDRHARSVLGKRGELATEAA